MCDQKIREAVPNMVKDYCNNILQPALRDMVNQEVAAIWNDTVSRLVGAITYEIYTNVSIALENGAQILNDQKTAKRISDAICQSIMQEIGTIKPIKL